VEGLNDDIERLKEETKAADQQLQDYIADEKKFAKVNEKHKAEHDKEKEVFEAKKAKFMECDRNISAAVAERDEMERDRSETEITIKRLKHDITGKHDEQKASQRKVEALEKAHPWITREKGFVNFCWLWLHSHIDMRLMGKLWFCRSFNEEDGEYHFIPKNVQTNTSQLKKLEDEQKTLSKSINAKAAAMLEKYGRLGSNERNLTHLCVCFFFLKGWGRSRRIDS